MRRRAVVGTVVAQDVASRTFALWLASRGRAGASGSASDPFGSWRDVLERLRYLETYGVRTVRVRLLSPMAVRPSRVEREAIRQIEERGMRLTFEALELERRGAAARARP